MQSVPGTNSAKPAVWSLVGVCGDGQLVRKVALNGGQLVDSADAMCLRLQGNVNLLCRGMILGQVGQNATVYVRLPYSETLYLMSTEGKKFDR